ncbi:hypothetical protein LMG1864_05039 [Achromobacter ruhlandii]|nr:hypothetical protein LMG1864_05039 [Achromobacter ruhlandii]
MGMVAASSKLRLSGLATTWRASTTMEEPKAPRASPNTGSPGLKCLTALPTSVTTPANSRPRAGISTIPSAFSTSRKFTPVALTAARISPAASGSSTSVLTDSGWSRRPLVAISRRQLPSAGNTRPGLAGAFFRRGASSLPPRSAHSGSSANASADASVSRSAAVSPRSTMRRASSGCSLRAVRSRPHKGLAPRSDTGSSLLVPTAPRVTQMTGLVKPASASSCTCTSALAAWRCDAFSTAPSPAHSWITPSQASASFNWAMSTTCAPASPRRDRSASAHGVPLPPIRPQVPPNTASGASTGCHSVRNRKRSTPAAASRRSAARSMRRACRRCSRPTCSPVVSYRSSEAQNSPSPSSKSATLTQTSASPSFQTDRRSASNGTNTSSPTCAFRRWVSSSECIEASSSAGCRP